MNSRLLNVAQLITAALNLEATPSDVAARVRATPTANWELLIRHADRHSLTPLLYDVWRQAGALQFAPVSARQRMQQAFADNARRNIHIRQELLDIHRLLNRAGVPHIVLKGWPLVERLYDHPAHRVLYDHDFLVPADRAGAGQQALLQAGFTPVPTGDMWVKKHLPSLWRNNGYAWDGYLFDPDYPRPVELHLMLWEEGWRGLQVSQMPHLWHSAQERPVAGEPMLTLSDEAMLVHLAVHFTGHLVEREARLNQLLDVARFLQRSPCLDWERVWALATGAGVGRFVYAALALARRIFAAPLPPANLWARLADSTPPVFRDWLSNHGPVDVLTSDYQRKRRGQDYRLTFLAADSLRERLGIVRFALLPPLPHLQAKYQFSTRWMGLWYYPRFLLERVSDYTRDLFRHYKVEA